jgi:6-pyruvoyltetrahydropterin/6-carboxytetrahydropterin synthase
MLSKHPEACRYPHGHSRRIEVVVSAEQLDANDMVLDFKALKLAVGDYIERYDHRMALNANDPLLDPMRQIHPDSVIVFQDQDPTTEVLAKDIYDFVSCVLRDGFEGTSNSGKPYRIPGARARLDRVRVWETESSWAEFGD